MTKQNKRRLGGSKNSENEPINGNKEAVSTKIASFFRKESAYLRFASFNL
jgi:hypothetical protein